MLKFFKFLFSGLITYWINIGLTFILINYFDFSKDIAYFISIFFVTIINFFLSLKFTFQNSYSNSIFVKYIIFLILFSLFNYLSVYFVKHVFPFNYYLLIFIATTITFFFKFFIYNKYVFDNCKNDKVWLCRDKTVL